MYVHMTHEPLGRSAGGGIPEGKTSPEHGLDSLLIAEADSEVEAHGFAVSRTTFEQQVRAGEFEALNIAASSRVITARRTPRKIVSRGCVTSDSGA
jgi:hypothetical protein